MSICTYKFSSVKYTDLVREANECIFMYFHIRSLEIIFDFPININLYIKVEY